MSKADNSNGYVTLAVLLVLGLLAAIVSSGTGKVGCAICPANTALTPPVSDKCPAMILKCRPF